MESLETRLKKIEQRLANLEKFIAESTLPRNKTKNMANDFSINSSFTPELFENNYHYDYSKEINKSTKTEKVKFHSVDTSIFNAPSKVALAEDSLPTILVGTLIVLFLVLVGKFLLGANWISQLTQISIATIMASGFVGAAFFLKNYNKPYTKYLPIIGIGLFQTVIFGASNYYNILPKYVALMFCLSLSVFTFYLYYEFKLVIYQILSVVGGFLLPMYISYGHDMPFTNFYFLILSLVILGAARFFDQIPAVVIGAFLSLFVSGISDYVDQDIMNKVLFTLGHFVIFTSSFVLSSIRSKEGINKWFNGAFFVYLLSFYVVQFNYVESLGKVYITSFAAAMIFILGLGYTWVSKKVQSHVGEQIAAWLGTIQIAITSHALFFYVLPTKMRAIAIIIAGFAFFKTFNLWGNEDSLLKRYLTYLTMLIVSLNSAEVLFKVFSTDLKLESANALIFSIVLFFFAYFEESIGHTKTKREWLVSFAYLFALAFTYGVTADNELSVRVGALVVLSIISVGHIIFEFRAANSISNT